MTLTNNTKLASAEYQADFAEAAAAETVAEGGEGLALEGSTPAINGDWTYSATAEGRTGEVAGDTSLDLDGDPGVIYSGTPGNAVRVKVTNLDLDHGLIAPEATDTVTIAIMLNNDVVAYADEGFVSEMDAEPAIEFNVDTYVGGLQTNDVIRVAVIGGGEETMDMDVALGGTLNII